MKWMTVLRKRANMTQKDLAERARISRSNISLIESGKMAAFPLWKKRLAEALGVPAEKADLLFEEVRLDARHYFTNPEQATL